MKLIREIPCKQALGKIKWSDAGSQILSFDRESIISYIINGDVSTIPINPFQIIFDVAYINETKIVAVGVSVHGHGIAIYDIKTHKVIRYADSEYLMSVCVDKSGKRIFAGAVEKIVYIYDFLLNQQTILRSEFVSPIISIAYAKDKLAIAGVFVEVWDLVVEPKLLTKKIPKEHDCPGNPCESNLIDISLDGRIAVAGFHGAQGVCVALEGQTGEVMRWFGLKSNGMNPYYQAGVLSVSRDGRYLATGFNGTASIAFYEIATGIITHKYDKPSSDIAFSPTEDIIAIGAEKAIILWEYDG